MAARPRRLAGPRPNAGALQARQKNRIRPSNKRGAPGGSAASVGAAQTGTAARREGLPLGRRLVPVYPPASMQDEGTRILESRPESGGRGTASDARFESPRVVGGGPVRIAASGWRWSEGKTTTARRRIRERRMGTAPAGAASAGLDAKPWISSLPGEMACPRAKLTGPAQRVSTRPGRPMRGELPSLTKGNKGTKPDHRLPAQGAEGGRGLGEPHPKSAPTTASRASCGRRPPELHTLAEDRAARQTRPEAELNRRCSAGVCASGTSRLGVTSEVGLTA